MDDRAALGIVGGPDHAADPGVADGPRAHGAGLQRHIEGQAGQPVVAESPGPPRAWPRSRRGRSGRRRRRGHLRPSATTSPVASSTTTQPTGTSPASAAACARSNAMRMNRSSWPAIPTTTTRSRRPVKSRARTSPATARRAAPRALALPLRPFSNPATKSPESGRGSRQRARLCAGQGRAARKPRQGQGSAQAGGKPRRQRTPRPPSPNAASGSPRPWPAPGIASRREVERLIGLGKVAVNGRILDTPATLVTRDDVITVERQADRGGPGHARLALQQAGRPADLAQRSGRAADRVRRPAQRSAARDLGRASGHQHRRPAAADQRRRAEPRAGAARRRPWCVSTGRGRGVG